MPRAERVAVSSSGPSLRDEMDHHFGRCRCFLIAEGGTVCAVDNTAREAAEGAGVKAAQLMIDHGADIVITGSLGPKALQVLHAAGVRTCVGRSGTVDEVLRDHRDGRMEDTGSSGQ